MDHAATTTIPCAFCRGRGVDPYGSASECIRCEVCRGKGKNVVSTAYVACVFCQRSGSYKTFSCLVCRGTGVVPPVAGPVRRCDECRGRAFDPSSGLPCLRCRGRGVVSDRAAAPKRTTGPYLEATHAEAEAAVAAVREAFAPSSQSIQSLPVEPVRQEPSVSKEGESGRRSVAGAAVALTPTTAPTAGV